MLEIWGRTSSSNVQKVLWLCAEIGLPFQRIDAGGPFGRTSEPAYRAMNPNGLVPTIRDGEFVLWESNTILRYLASKHHAHALYPAGLRPRADIERWMDWANTALGPAFSGAFWGLIRAPSGQRDPAAIIASAEKTAEQLAIIDAQLHGRSFVCGDAFTLADIPIGIQVYRWLNLPFDTVGYARPALPNLAAWYRRLGERAGYRSVVMITIT